jgi:hypothetical protein
MRALLFVCALAFAAPAFAESGAGEGSETIVGGASVAGAGSVALVSGESEAGVVSIPMGGASMVAGSAQVVGDSAHAVTNTASAAIDVLFSQPVTIDKTTVTAQPAPQVPYQAQTR